MVPPPIMRLAILAGAALCVSGCCGGYSVVQTRLERPSSVRDAGAHVLHFSRVGEPANSCGEGVKYVEDLFLRVPSLRLGETWPIGAGGVTATYSRSQEGQPPVESNRISGTVSLEEQASDGLVARLAIEIVLASGDVVSLDDSYTFHPSP